MKTKLRSLLAVPLVLGCSAAWSQDADDDTPGLPTQAAEQARGAAQLPEAAPKGLATAAEATIRLMDDDDDEVTNELELPMLPERGAPGQKGRDIAAEAKARRNDRDNFGRERAEEARNNASEAAEGRGRAEDLPDNVPGRPENRGRPDNPGRPNS